ncbi:MAG: phosphate signaling complex protein PhoU [Paracoccaceae bacterium]|nr:phosphate signaling complex protein PhoU [Paracoccaceae bacterium]
MIDSAHIHRAFDADLERIRNLILEMGGLTEVQIEESAEVLLRRDNEGAAAVIERDKRIDELELEIDTEVVRVLALRQPIAQDLRMVITVMKIAGNLERIGDYARNNAKRAMAIAHAPPVGNAAGTLKRMARAVQDMLRDGLDAYVKGDVDLAADVRIRDEEVDQMYNGLFRELLTHMMEDPRHISPSMHLLFVAKNIERMGDHVTGIVEQVIFTITGELPEDDRPKGDDSSYAEIMPNDIAPKGQE